MTIQRVQPGDRIKADHHNSIVDSLSGLRKVSGSGGVQVSHNPQGVSVSQAGGITYTGGAIQCAAKNIEDTDTLNLYEPVVIAGQIHDAVGDVGLYGPPVLAVRRRQADDDEDMPVAIVSESMAAGYAGRVYTIGVCLAYLDSTESEVRASYDVDGGTSLTLDSGGSIEVLWVNDDVSKPGMVRLGGGGGDCLWEYDEDGYIVSKIGGWRGTHTLGAPEE